MRTLGVAIAAFVALSCGALAAEPGVAISAAVPAATAPAPVYPLGWQRRLLAAQLAFAATLPKVDPVETGSITPSGQ